MKIIIGLGNPGTSYSKTRHNIGRRLVEYAASRHAVRFSKNKPLQSSLAPVSWMGEEVFLTCPESFMNVSGEPAARVTEHFGIDPSKDLLVIVDDVALPYGQLRLRAKGSDGGHNGLKSVQLALQTAAYARLRIGIRPVSGDAACKPPPGEILKDFVLAKFSSAEERDLEHVLAKGFEACAIWIKSPIEKAMSAVNHCVK